MQEWLNFINEETEKLLALPGGDIYEPRLTAQPPMHKYDKIPHCIYFYYVRFDRNGKLFVTHYCWPNKDHTKWTGEIQHADVPKLLPKLVEIARPRTPASGKADYLLPSKNFERVPWTHKSYIAIYVDEVNWLFHRRLGNPARASVTVDGNNYTFFDARDVILDIQIGHGPTTDKRSAIYFVNHMKRNAAGDDIEYMEELTYKFNLNMIVQYADSMTPGAMVAIDPGGNNLGPPQSPP